MYNPRSHNHFQPLIRGFDANSLAPHTLYTEVRLENIRAHENLIPLSVSDRAGLHIAAERHGRGVYITGHAEYYRDTLAKEYFRDVNKGLDPQKPYNYFPEDDASKTPPFTWRSNGHLLVSNWLNCYVYQQTPYNFIDEKR